MLDDSNVEKNGDFLLLTRRCSESVGGRTNVAIDH